MVHSQQDRGLGYGTPETQTVQAEHDRYRTALGTIHHAATVAAQCPCCLLVARVASAALTPPPSPLDYWLHCEA